MHDAVYELYTKNVTANQGDGCMSRCTKEEFVECVSELAEHYKKFNAWIDGLEEYLPGAFEGIIENNFYSIKTHATTFMYFV